MATQKKTAVRLVFDLTEMNQDQINHVFEAASHLHEAGINFDTSSGPGEHEWSLDWSLNGPMRVRILESD